MSGARGPADSGGRRAASALVFLAILVLGIGLRLRYLDEGALFIDEAESSLNALSILERGYPADNYMGLPMFENTLTDPWPESGEYEFRDTSYSSRGMAIYHGWLPLYAIAGSLALHGIGPDVPTNPPRVQHDDAEIARRIHAVRLPSVIFGALFLAGLFWAGRALYGNDAGFAAMLAGALMPKSVWAAQQARYFSATLAFTALSMGCVWMAYRRGRWRDFLAAALALVLLFHTSSIAFGLLALGCVVLLPAAVRRPGGPRRLAGSLALVVLGIAPWMLWSGYFEHFGRLVMARELLDFPADYVQYLAERPARTLAGALALGAFALLWALRRRLPERLAAPVAAAGMPVLFLALGSLITFFGFQALMPATSVVLGRLTCMLLAGAILLCGVAAAGVARVVAPRYSAAGAVLLALAALVGSGNALQWQRRNMEETQGAFALVDHLRGLDLAAGTRIYALPNQHFCLTFYTGLPIQSIAPVRREFLDGYEGEVVILETAKRVQPPQPERVKELAGEAGVALSEAEVSEWRQDLQTLMIRSELQSLVRSLAPPAEPPPPTWAQASVPALLEEWEQPGPHHLDFSRDGPAMFKGMRPMTVDEFWPAFFYRFVGPERRRGPLLNYAQRMREARAELLACNWTVLRCPARGGGTQ